MSRDLQKMTQLVFVRSA